MANTLRIRGYREFLQACAQSTPDTRKAVRAAFRDVGEGIRTDASSRFAGIHARSAGGFRTRVRQRGIAVEQSIRRTTGRHPEFGSLQMRRALLPATRANEDDLERRMDRALDQVADRFERTP